MAAAVPSSAAPTADQIEVLLTDLNRTVGELNDMAIARVAVRGLPPPLVAASAPLSASGTRLSASSAPLLSAVGPIDLPRRRPPRAVVAAGVDAWLSRLEALATAGPRDSLVARSKLVAAPLRVDLGVALGDGALGPADALEAAGAAIGRLTADHPQAGLVSAAAASLAKGVRALCRVVSTAATMAKPTAPTALASLTEELTDAIEEARDARHDVAPASKLRNHACAISDAASALGWVLAPAPVKHVREYKAIVNSQTEAILASYIDLGCNASHVEFAEALDAIMATLAEHVSEHHPTGLRWNTAAASSAPAMVSAPSAAPPGAHPLADYWLLVDGPVAEYVTASERLGGPIADQAWLLRDAFLAQSDMVEVVARTLRPVNAAAAAVFSEATTAALSRVVGAPAKAPRGYLFGAHLGLISEFAHALSWPSMGETVSPGMFVVDLETALIREADDVLGAVGPSPWAGLHTTWVATVRAMVTGLRAYVRSHHAASVGWDSGATRAEGEALLEEKGIEAALAALRAANARGTDWAAAKQQQRVRMAKGRMHGQERLELKAKKRAAARQQRAQLRKKALG
ncbi:hypothetical protein I4F81_008065 [Pyropia yezoensis]|uniref:Uncharacterized protein n=1 Tax=Pyropia yezoensis TaxID=2788 RepID=A0ACC3C6C9_PYRYE|nr:hypothetical protein I4F81_008065 [Neopyropia yezoensis]|eukprot:contig_7176_g1665